MENPQEEIEKNNPDQSFKYEGLLWMLLLVLIITLAAILIQRNWKSISNGLGLQSQVNFDEVMATKGVHDVTLENGRAFDISYETSSKRDFAGLVRHTSAIVESSFPILTFDILVTSGDFSNADLVQTSVSNHHFTWMSPTLSQPQGNINLLHTVPINDEVNNALKSIQNGDTVIITGYDIYRIEGYDSNGNYIGYWQDSGCNTTLVTEVKIIN